MKKNGYMAMVAASIVAVYWLTLHYEQCALPAGPTESASNSVDSLPHNLPRPIEVPIDFARIQEAKKKSLNNEKAVKDQAASIGMLDLYETRQKRFEKLYLDVMGVPPVDLTQQQMIDRIHAKRNGK